MFDPVDPPSSFFQNGATGVQLRQLDQEGRTSHWLPTDARIPTGCVWKWLVSLNPMVLLIIIPMKNGYFIGNIYPIFRQTQLGLWLINWRCWSSFSFTTCARWEKNTSWFALCRYFFFGSNLRWSEKILERGISQWNWKNQSRQRNQGRSCSTFQPVAHSDCANPRMGNGCRWRGARNHALHGDKDTCLPIVSACFSSGRETWDSKFLHEKCPQLKFESGTWYPLVN